MNRNRITEYRSIGLLLVFAAFFLVLSNDGFAQQVTTVQGGTGGGVTTGDAPGQTSGSALEGIGASPAPLDLSVSGEAVLRSNYRLGPGDRLLITISGDVYRSWESVVTPEGLAIIEPAGGIRVAGLDLDQAAEVISRELGGYYRNVRITTLLIGVRQFEVHVLGEVRRPGRYVANALTTVSAIVQSAGGATGAGSTRNIRLLKTDGREFRADMDQFLKIGKTDHNPLLTEGDRIVIPINTGNVLVSGHVGRPGHYEWVDGERLKDYIDLSGGFLAGAIRSRIEVYQFKNGSGSLVDSLSCDLEEGEGEIGEADNPVIKMGDQIFIRRLPDWHERTIAVVSGEVFYPGEYAIREGTETLLDLIARAGGVKEEGSLHEATLVRRTGQDEYDPEFERLKLIPVADMTEDEYEYLKLRSRERKGRVVVDFGKLLEGGEGGEENEDLLLLRGDRITIPARKNAIAVSGQVANPGSVEYIIGEEVEYYIDRAGGYGWRARKNKTRIIRARTGEWLYASKVRHLEAGDTIWIPEKPQRDWWQIFKDTMTIAAQVATVYIVIDRASE